MTHERKWCVWVSVIRVVSSVFTEYQRLVLIYRPLQLWINDVMIRNRKQIRTLFFMYHEKYCTREGRFGVCESAMSRSDHSWFSFVALSTRSSLLFALITNANLLPLARTTTSYPFVRPILSLRAEWNNCALRSLSFSLLSIYLSSYLTT